MLLDENTATIDQAGRSLAEQQRLPITALDNWLEERLFWAPPTTEEELEELVSDLGREPWLWGDAIRFDEQRRGHVSLYESPDLSIGLFTWAAGQGTRFHDHGQAIGAAYISSGRLFEDVLDAEDGKVVAERSFVRDAESSFRFGPDYIHRVSHDPSQGLCVSIHAYAPAVGEAIDYEVVDGALRVV